MQCVPKRGFGNKYIFGGLGTSTFFVFFGGGSNNSLVPKPDVGSSFPNPCLGMTNVVWDGKDKSGNEVKSGVYFYKIDNDDKHIGKVVKL